MKSTIRLTSGRKISADLDESTGLVYWINDNHERMVSTVSAINSKGAEVIVDSVAPIENPEPKPKRGRPKLKV